MAVRESKDIPFKLEGCTQLIFDNPLSYQFLYMIGMLYVSMMLCNTILTNCYIGINSFFLLGGIITSPFQFLMDGIIAEIYGYRVARCVILSGFFAQSIFVLLCQLALTLPHPYLQDEAVYNSILGHTLVQIGISSLLAYIVSNLLNSYLISKWKFLLKGRRFWLRSLGASAFAEALYLFIAIPMMEFQLIPAAKILKLVLASYLIKLSYSLIFAVPANFLVNYLKKAIGIRAYDFPKKLTPFECANWMQQ